MEQAQFGQKSERNSVSTQSSSSSNADCATDSKLEQKKVSYMSQQDTKAQFKKRYKVTRMLARGGQAYVRKGHDIQNNKEVAMKVYKKEKLSARALQMVYHEKECMERLSHPCIGSVYDYFEDESLVCLVTELMFSDMDELLKTGARRLGESDIKHIFFKMLEAVDHTHSAGIIHRDIKLGNFLIDTEGDEVQVKLIDFGMAVQYDQKNPPKQRCGTAYTMAPEIIQKQSYDYKVDCWSLGVILFQMLTNDLPFNNFEEVIYQEEIKFKSFPVMNEKSVEVRDLIKQLTLKDPYCRISAKEALKHHWFNEYKYDQVRQQIIKRK